MHKFDKYLFWFKNKNLANKPQEVKDFIIINAWLRGSADVRKAWSAQQIADMARKIDSSWAWVHIGFQKDLPDYQKITQMATITVSLIEHLIDTYQPSNVVKSNSDKEILNTLLLEKARQYAGFGCYDFFIQPDEIAQPLRSSLTNENYFIATQRILDNNLLVNPREPGDKEIMIQVIETEFKNHLKYVGNLDYILTFISERNDSQNILIDTFLKVSGARRYYKILNDFGRYYSINGAVSLENPSQQIQSGYLVHAANIYTNFAPAIIEHIVKTDGIKHLKICYDILCKQSYNMELNPIVKTLVEKYLLCNELANSTLENKTINKI